SEPHVGGLPEPLGWLVYRCLTKDAAGRPSARDVLGELVAAGARLEGPMPPHGSGEGLLAARPASGPRSARHGSHRSRWRRRAPVLLAVGLLVATVGVLAVNLPRHGAAPQRLAGRQTQITAEIKARKQAITWILQQL